MTSARVGDGVIDALFDGVIEATEEAIVNALVAAETMIGRDGITAHALPHDRLVEVMARYGRASAAAPEPRLGGARQPRPGRRAADRPSAGPCPQPAVTGAGFSIGTPIRLPYSVQLPS